MNHIMGDNMLEHIFGYRKVGNAELYQGREWLSTAGSGGMV